jgi:NAD-dependent dihydropyrimidine dehydrogenase PreA subunit
MRRKIITIDQDRCSGCGMCATDCPEGALQVIDGKARLVGDLLCDGLGACLQSCPGNAISIEEREAEEYNEIKVMDNIVPQGRNVILAHLEHLRKHFQKRHLGEALSYLRDHKIEIDLPPEITDLFAAPRQCPGSKTVSFPSHPLVAMDGPPRASQLTHWPIQLHLISPAAPHYSGSDLLVAADCVAYSLADFHKDYLKDKTLVIACPKLDSRQEIYIDKLTTLIDHARVKSIRVMIMQVPCCSGLLRHVVEAANRAKNKIPVSCVIVGIQGDVLSETQIETDPVEAFA